MAMGPIMGQGRRGRRTPMAEINVTPMVDVMLVLLIIFMVTAPLLVAGVPVDLPDSKAGALEQDRPPLQISMAGDGGIFIDEEPVAEAELGAILAAKAPRGGAEAPPVFLRADRGIEYGRVMRVMGELNRAGLNKVSLVTTGSDDG